MDRGVGASSQVAGSFSFVNLVTELFGTDVGQLSTNLSKPPNDNQRLYSAYTASTQAQLGKDVLLGLRQLRPDLPPDMEARLFHERVHFWQVISCPMLEWSFTLLLEKLRIEVLRRGGAHTLVFGQLMPGQVKGSEDIDRLLAQAAAHFDPFEVEPNMIRSVDGVPTDPSIHQLFLLVPIVGAAPLELPAYAAGFRLGPDQGAVVPFVGRNLLESAAYVCQLLHEGKPLPIPAPVEDAEDQMYLGCWEFWRRMHGPRYGSEEEMILGFLAAVDLTMVSDLEFENSGSEYQYEMNSIPYRFGKLVYRAQGFPPLSCPDGDAAKAIARFQEEFSAWTGWPSPATSLKKMAVLLTRLLVQGFVYSVPETDEAVPTISWLFDTPTETVVDRFEELKVIWGLFWRQKKLHQGFMLGQNIVGMMLNACLDRISNPGQLAAPHLYWEALARRFPLPVVVHGGEFYLDVAEEVGVPPSLDLPYPVTAFELLWDCIGLITMEPLLHNSTKCGFLEALTDCAYIRAGLGCPFKRLTTKEKTIRARTNLDDWCHWTYNAVALRTAPPEIVQRWHAARR